MLGVLLTLHARRAADRDAYRKESPVQFSFLYLPLFRVDEPGPVIIIDCCVYQFNLTKREARMSQQGAEKDQPTRIRFKGQYADQLKDFVDLMDRLWVDHRTSPTKAANEEFY